MYLIKNATVHIGNGTVLQQSDVLVEGKTIKAVGKDLEAQGAQIIDATGCEVFPGFIDPVSSIGAMGIPGRYLDNNEATNPITPEMNLRYSIDPDEVNRQEFYLSGITTIGLSPTNSNVMGGQIAVCKTAPQKMGERLVKEHAALKCSVTSSVKETYGRRDQLPKTKMGTFYLFQESLRKARAEKEDERTQAQQVICDVFDNCSMPVFVAADTKLEIDGILHLMKDEKVQLTLVDGFCFADSIEQIKEQNVGLILGNVNGYSEFAKHGMDMTKLCELVENGNRVAFTNSNGGHSEGREVFIWSAIEAYRAGVPEEEVVRMMTEHPAHMLGIQDRVGTLEVGKDADLSVYTGNPVTTYAAKVKHSMINGEVIF